MSFLTFRKKEDFPSQLEDKEVLELARKYEKTPAQILLRFLIQNGVSVIPKSSNPKRILENIQVKSEPICRSRMRSLSQFLKVSQFCLVGI